MPREATRRAREPELVLIERGDAGEDGPLTERERAFARAIIREIIEEWQAEDQQT